MVFGSFFLWFLCLLVVFVAFGNFWCLMWYSVDFGSCLFSFVMVMGIF